MSSSDLQKKTILLELFSEKNLDVENLEKSYFLRQDISLNTLQLIQAIINDNTELFNSCVEKVKEKCLVFDKIEDALLMGCSLQIMKEILIKLITSTTDNESNKFLQILDNGGMCFDCVFFTRFEMNGLFV